MLIKAFGTKDQMLDSPIIEGLYQIFYDTLPSPKISPKESIQKMDFEISIACEDGQIHFTNDSSNPSN